MLPHLNMHIDLNLLRIDWPLLLSACALGGTLLGGVTVGVHLRRTRRRVLGTLERVFEQLDLMRFDAQPADEAVVVLPQAGEATQSTGARNDVREDAGISVSPAARRAMPPAELADYQAAARLAAHGAPLSEIAERCGVVAGEARVLLALQQRAANARRGSLT